MNDEWWVWVDSNHRPHPYQGCALTKLIYRPVLNGSAWAPLITTGNIFNPVLFMINRRSLIFQTQLTWIILPPILCLAAIKLAKKY